MFFKKKETRSFPKVMGLYFGNKLDTVILAPCHFAGEASSEINGKAIKLSNEDSSVLGSAFLERLTHSNSDSNNTSVQNKKLRDCPAFIVSDLKTVKEFKKEYSSYYVRGVNEANLFYEITSPKLANGIELRIVINPYEAPHKIGMELQKLHQFYIKCKENTF